MKNKHPNFIVNLFLIGLLFSNHILAKTNDLSVNVSASNKHLVQTGGSSSNEMYVIVGTYLKEDNAVNHVLKAKSRVATAGYFFNINKYTYYVYAYKSDNRQVTLEKLFQLRNYEMFKDAWFYQHQSSKVNKNKVASNKIYAKKNSRQPILSDIILDKEATEKPDRATLKPTVTDIPILNASVIPKQQEEKTTSAEKNNDVLLVDNRSKLTPENIHLKLPEIEKNEVNLIENAPTIAAVDQLHSAKSGDVIIFNNLLFHRNAAILQKSSAEDLSALLKYLNKNPASRIKIHGHTNGEFRGEIVKMGKKDKNYFATSSKNIYVMGDEVLLSMERAKVIKRYLLENGVLGGRVEIGGWGGQKTIYPASSGNAKLNSRVEIEIL